MERHYHSVRLEESSCKGCTTCIRYCPTKAIRVQNGKARILKERCIDCGECIRRCPYHAKKAVTDGFELLDEYRYRIALPAPAFCAQFSKAADFDVVLTGLKALGFDHVYEVARGAEMITAQMQRMMQAGELKTPVISSACPAVVRLVSVKFPGLIDHVAPLTSPMEAAAASARKEARETYGYKDEEIGVFFISPCAAKMTAVKEPIAITKSAVSGVLSIKDVYLRLAHKLDKVAAVEHLSVAGRNGVRWAKHGGEAEALNSKRYLAIDGINNVMRVFEQLEDEKIRDIDFIEALACTGGCVGGPLTVENEFVAESRLRQMTESLEVKTAQPDQELPLAWDKPLVSRPFSPLDKDFMTAMQKAAKMNEIFESLPQLDCGSCGSPSCRDLAEDIVRGRANVTDCIFKLRERVSELAKEMAELESQMPPSIGAAAKSNGATPSQTNLFDTNVSDTDLSDTFVSREGE